MCGLIPRGSLQRSLLQKNSGQAWPKHSGLVYETRFKPPRESGRGFQWICLGHYATSEEASILYQIAAFYYNEGQGGSLDLEDGLWFSIPPMSGVERSPTGAEKRAWVKVQAMKVYEDFRKEKAETALLQELFKACEDQVTPRQGVDPSEASLLNSAEHQLPLLVSPAENSGMAIAMLDDQGLECASQSFGGMHEPKPRKPSSELDNSWVIVGYTCTCSALWLYLAVM